MAANASKSSSLHARSRRREVCAGKIMVLIFYRVNVASRMDAGSAASREPELWFRPGFCRVVRSPSSAGRHSSLSLSDWFSVAVICLPLFGRRYPVAVISRLLQIAVLRWPSCRRGFRSLPSGWPSSGCCHPASVTRPSSARCRSLKLSPPPGFSWLRPYSATSFFERLRVLIVR